MEFILISIATAFNLIIIKTKIERKRYEDAFFDASILTILTLVFAGSFAGLVVATITSCLISLYLLMSPPTFTSGIRKAFSTFKSRAARKRS